MVLCGEVDFVNGTQGFIYILSWAMQGKSSSRRDEMYNRDISKALGRNQEYMLLEFGWPVRVRPTPR
jgi:hypothetical protein